MSVCLEEWKICHFGKTIKQTFHVLSLSKWTILDSSKLKEFAYDNFEFAKHDRKFSKRVENSVGKGEIAHDEKFLLFPHWFLKTCTAHT